MFIVKTRLYLHNTDYKRIVILSKNATGVKTTLLPDKPLSQFAGDRQYGCFHAVMSIRNPNELMISDELPELLCCLVENGYTIDPALLYCITDGLLTVLGIKASLQEV